MKPVWSIRRRMLALAVGIAALAWLVGGVVTIEAARDVEARVRDARLALLAETVTAFAEHELAESQPAAAPPGQMQELDLRYRYQVWRGPRLLLRSPDAPPAAPLAPARQPGYADLRLEGVQWRSYVRIAPAGGLEVHVAELLDGGGRRIVWPGAWVLALMALSLAGVALLAGMLVVRALAPMARAERELRTRSPQDLAPLVASDAPQEMRPLLEALNTLLQRTAERLSREHGFTALAAHELRTPLAALRMQAQVLLGEADPARRAEHTAALLASVDRSDHLLAQLLTLSRIGNPDDTPAEDIDLRALCEEALDELAPELERHGTEVRLDLAAPVLRGHRFALQTLLRNLLANAALHAGAGATVRLSSRRDGAAVVLDVDDSGPGIAAADRSRVFERFVRLAPPGERVGRGVGLGLSIVRQVAEAHGAVVELLDSPLGGLRVEVRFPQPPAAAPADSPARAP